MKKIITLMLNPSVDVMLRFDRFTKSKTNRVIEEFESMGGKGLNVSFVAKSFGLSVCATGFIGADRKDELSDVLKKAEIENAFIEATGKTRTNFKLLDSKEGSVTEANGKGFYISPEKITELSECVDKLLCDAEILVLTGSLPCGVDSGFYAKCVEMANLRGVKAIVDASGEALKLAIEKKPYAIKPNIDELSEFVKRELETEEQVISAIKDLSKNGISLVAVSMGEKGAIFSLDGKIVKANAFPVEFKSAVGAGDSMVGAMCYAIANGLSLEQTAMLSVAAGCVTTSKIATNLCSADEVLKNKEKVDVRMII